MSRLLETAPSGVRSCLLSQVGHVAQRNSCTAPWSTSLDMQLNLRPNLGGTVQRRLQMSLSLVNVPAGLDRLLHGRDELQGWGQRPFSNPTLLYVRGFDQDSGRFLYSVNEQFGSTASSRSAIRSPFLVTVQARLQIGRDRQREMLEGALRGGGMGARGGNRPDFRTMIERVAPDPAATVLQMADSLKLSAEQVAKLQRISDSLRVETDSLLSQLQEIQNQSGGTATGGGDLRGIFPRIQPLLQSARGHYVQATQQIHTVLTPAQWEQLPEWIKNPSLQRGPARRRP
jgi:hypothetical protein